MSERRVPFLLLLLVASVVTLGLLSRMEQIEAPPDEEEATPTAPVPLEAAPQEERQSPDPPPAKPTSEPPEESELPPAITGIVADVAGHPVDGVGVAVLPIDTDWRRQSVVRIVMYTDEDGRFTAPFDRRLVGRPVRLVIDGVRQGYILEERVLERGTGPVEVVLERGLVIAGVVSGPDGEPMPDVDVHILEDYRGSLRERRPVEGRVVTDEKGRFSDTAYRPGTYRVLLSGSLDRHKFHAVHEGIAAGEETLRLNFPGFGSARFALEDAATGESLKEAAFVIEYIWDHRGSEERFVRWNVFAPRTGEVVLDHLPQGYYRVRISRMGYREFLSDLFFVEAKSDLGLIRFRLTSL